MKTAEKISERLKFKDEFEKIDFLSDTFQLDLLHQFIQNTGSKKTEIAKKMKVSNSFVTQLFTGDKKMSLTHLASLVYHFDLELKFDLKSKIPCKVKYINDYVNKDESGFLNASNATTKFTITSQKVDPEKKVSGI